MLAFMLVGLLCLAMETPPVKALPLTVRCGLRGEPTTVALQPGWNLVSLPERPVDPGLESIFSDPRDSTKMTTVTHVFSLQGRRWVSARFDPASGTWDKGGGLTHIMDGWAYFILSSAEDAIRYNSTGYAPAITRQYRLLEGWNAIGVASECGETIALASYLESVASKWTEARMYVDGRFISAFNGGTYRTADNWSPKADGIPQVIAGRGYYVLLNADAVLGPFDY